MKAARIVLVTGANRGIGFELARQLAERQFRVLVGTRNERAGREAAEKIGERATFLPLDVSDQASIRRAAAKFGELADHLDVLINNAGILLDGDDSILTTTPELFESTMRTNALGPALLAAAFRPWLVKSRTPRIVNVSSGSGQLIQGADGWAPAYSISKTALNGVTVQLAAALPGVAVNAVCPGWVRTDMGGSGANRSPEEGADTIVWLATDAPQKLTGKFLRDRKPIAW